MSLSVLIVDDEPLAQEVLETYLLKMPDITLAGKCSNALEAFSFLNAKPVDLLLLDINMPEISGMDFLRMLKHPPMVIFTTAYSEFALAGYEVDAIDYLVKPIPFDRFVKAIQKAKDKLKPAVGTAPSVTGDVAILFVRTEGKLVKIDLDQLWLVEGLKDYIRLWSDTGRVIVHSTMKNFEEQLSGRPAFIRVNKSYIINLKYVTEIDGNVVRIKDQIITIGSTYRDAVHEVFNSYRLL